MIEDITRVEELVNCCRDKVNLMFGLEH